MDFDWSVIGGSLPYLWKGMQYTLHLTAIAALGGLFFGTLLALARLSPIKPLSLFAAGYVNLMRSIPLVLVIFWFFFLVPVILQVAMGYERPPQVGAERTAIITFIMFEAAYFCEIMRAGIQSIPRGQVHAAQALGLNYSQTMRLVVLPQALRVIIPPMTNQYLNLTKNSSLAVACGYTDLYSVAETSLNQTGRAIEVIVILLAAYLAIDLVISLVMNGLNRLVQIKER